MTKVDRKRGFTHTSFLGKDRYFHIFMIPRLPRIAKKYLHFIVKRYILFPVLTGAYMKIQKQRIIRLDGWIKNEQGYPEFVVLSQHFKEDKCTRENRYTVRPYAPDPRERCECEWSHWGNKAKMCAHQEFVKSLIMKSLRERVVA